MDGRIAMKIVFTVERGIEKRRTGEGEVPQRRDHTHTHKDLQKKRILLRNSIKN